MKYLSLLLCAVSISAQSRVTVRSPVFNSDHFAFDSNNQMSIKSGSILTNAVINTNLSGLGSLSSSGLVAKTGTGAFSERTITGTANQITVSNGNGVSGNPTLSLGFVIQRGTITNSADMKVTNTFSVAYSSAPVVVVSGPTNSLPHIVSISTTAVVFGSASTDILNWIAIGAP